MGQRSRVVPYTLAPACGQNTPLSRENQGGVRGSRRSPLLVLLTGSAHEALLTPAPVPALPPSHHNGCGRCSVPRLLVIEDDLKILRILERGLRAEGYEITTATTAAPDPTWKRTRMKRRRRR